MKNYSGWRLKIFTCLSVGKCIKPIVNLIDILTLVCSSWGSWTANSNFSGPCGSFYASRVPTGPCTPSSINYELYVFSDATYTSTCSAGTRIQRSYVRVQIDRYWLLSVVGQCQPGCFAYGPSRPMEVGYYITNVNTPALCISLCSSVGYSMAGLFSQIGSDSIIVLPYFTFNRARRLDRRRLQMLADFYKYDAIH